MTCPACGGELTPGGTRCPVCDAVVSAAPRTEGALAADSRLLTPPARGRRADTAPRDARSERSWRDEVQERVRSRRQKRVDEGLPLFDSLADAAPTPSAAPAAAATDIGDVELERPNLRDDLLASARSRVAMWQQQAARGRAQAAEAAAPEPADAGEVSLRPSVAGEHDAVERRATHEPDLALRYSEPRSLEPEPPPQRSLAPDGESAAAEPAGTPDDRSPLSEAAAPRATASPARDDDHAGPDVFSPMLTEAELADLPLRTVVPREAAAEAVSGAPERALERTPAALAAGSRLRPRAPALDPVVPSLDDNLVLDAHEREPEIELPPPAVEPAAVERPARALERLQAAAFDLAVFAALAFVVVYFAGRAARVELSSLTSAWVWLLSFVGLLGIFYATYFTGTTGQTPGKLVTGLRVVGASGRPPAYPRAAGRAVAGIVGIALAGAGLLPIVFDPARRALHDRLFRTRVVRG